MSDTLFAFAKSVSAMENPTDGDIRRAISACYYSLFHRICESTAAIFYERRNVNPTDEYERAYRAVDHGKLKSACDQYRGKNYSAPYPIKNFAQLVYTLQGERHDADYKPPTKTSTFTKNMLVNRVAEVEKNLRVWDNRAEDKKRAFIALILFSSRKGQ